VQTGRSVREWMGVKLGDMAEQRHRRVKEFRLSRSGSECKEGRAKLKSSGRTYHGTAHFHPRVLGIGANG
jgi:hypothetical protein